MKEKAGKEEFPIWLLGDSNPERWEDKLDEPLDSRHPARHNIWTPIIDIIQDRVFRKARKRINISNNTVYIRNAIKHVKDKPKRDELEWGKYVNDSIKVVNDSILKHHPKIILSFGAFAFEFGRRAIDERPERYKHWGAESMGEKFRERIKGFNIKEPNIFPLLHVSIARGKFLESHKYFCNGHGDNYFEHVGNELSKIILNHEHDLNDIWIK
ncbi:MAG: hypothetical protein HZA49_02905 [Planctomycetes bacterium]|nr:hypothetical protein [Planctomycetota bacterium]